MYPPGLTKPKDLTTPDVTKGGSVSLGTGGVTPYTAPGSGGTGNITPGTGTGGGINFAGVDPSSSRTGLQAQTALQGLIGRPLTPQELQQSFALSGYTDQTGAAPMTGAQYNMLLQEAQRRTPGSQFTAWTAPSTGGGGTTNTGTGNLNIAPAPAFNAPGINLPNYTAPDKFGGLTWEQAMANDPGIAARLSRGQNVLEHGAAAQGVLHSPNTLAGLINYNQEAAGDEYANAYNRAFGQWQSGYGVDRDTFLTNYQRASDEYNAALTGSQLEYAPGLLTWQAQNRTGELGFDRAWQEYLYNRDDAYRRETRDQNRYDMRDFYERDDLWRRYLSEVDQRQYLYGQGKD